MTSNITLQLDVFEGPLDLLLYLIKKSDLEVSRISLLQVATQYLQYLDNLQDMDIDVASDFLYMASELALIKSRHLLPSESQAQESGDEEDDVAGDLLRRLKEYEKYKNLSQQLAERKWLNRDVFTTQSIAYDDTVTEVVKDISVQVKSEIDADVYDLLRAFYTALQRLERGGREHTVLTERYSVADRVFQILEHLKTCESCLFDELFAEDHTRGEVVVTFLSLLEMAKHRMVEIFQTDEFGSIRLRRKVQEEEQINEENILPQIDQKQIGDWNDYK